MMQQSREGTSQKEAGTLSKDPSKIEASDPQGAPQLNNDCDHEICEFFPMIVDAMYDVDHL
jgi:hypothetical protein